MGEHSAIDVQVHEPGDRDRLRFGLTGEGGLNDGTAFALVMLGLGLLVAMPTSGLLQRPGGTLGVGLGCALLVAGASTASVVPRGANGVTATGLVVSKQTSARSRSRRRSPKSR